MNRSAHCRLLILILLRPAAGCSSPSPLPAVDQVTKIQLTVSRFPDEAAHRKTPVVANLAAAADIAAVMDWLNAIDWSQSGQDMAVIRIPSPDGGITVTTKAGATSEYSFYWDGKFVNTRANRLIRGGDVDKWRQIVTRVCK